ncbi:MAG: sulfotransferase, partial [Rhodothermales bacterium]
MCRPDFFIVGAPKCGTTAMFRYLQEHPEIYLPKKEFHHFGSDLRPPNYQGRNRDRAVYLSLFAGVTTEKRIGEASVWYLYSKKAAREIKAFAPEADVIIMLRNPVEMMYSLYSLFLWVRDLT